MDLLDSETKEDTGHDKCCKGLKQASMVSYEQPKLNLEQSHNHSPEVPSEGGSRSQAKTETLCPRGGQEGEESEREETESSDDNPTQYSIHPPHDCPYLLLLQGCSAAQVSHSGTTPTQFPS